MSIMQLRNETVSVGEKKGKLLRNTADSLLNISLFFSAEWWKFYIPLHELYINSSQHHKTLLINLYI